LNIRMQKARPNQNPLQAAALAGRRRPRASRLAAAARADSVYPATHSGASQYQPIGAKASTSSAPNPAAASCGSQCLPGRGRRIDGRHAVKRRCRATRGLSSKVYLRCRTLGRADTVMQCSGGACSS